MRLLLAASLLALPALAFAQGQLTPPSDAFSGGAPAPTMKSLDQIEPRTPLHDGAPGVTQNANGGFTISQPGSYYLTGNVTVASGDGIVITGNDVSLDLRGFTIATTAPDAEGCGILLPGSPAGIAIANGRILGTVTFDGSVYSSSGFQYGTSTLARSLSRSCHVVFSLWSAAVTRPSLVRSSRLR